LVNSKIIALFHTILEPSAMRFTIIGQTGFLPFLITRLFTMFAIQIQSIIVGWHLYDTLRDPMALAYVGLAQFIPMVFCLPIAGDVADRYNRKIILAIGLIIACLCSASLMIIAIEGKDYIYWTYAILIIFGMTRSFINPVLQSLLPQIVARDKLPQSLATNSTLMKLATILGPVSGGILYSVSSEFSYLACTLFFLLAVIPLVWVKLLYANQTPVTEAFQLSAVWQRFVEGILFIRQRPIVLGAISLDLFAVLLGGVVTLLPIYASEVLHVGAQGLGILRSSMSVGEILAGIYLTAFPIKKAVGKVMLVAVALFGMANLVFALSTWFWLSVAALMIAGICDMVSVNVRSSLIQLSTPDSLRGRVSAVNMLFISSSNELGEFRAGSTAHFIGTVPTAVTGSLMTLAVVFFMQLKFKSLVNVNTFAEAGVQNQKNIHA